MENLKEFVRVNARPLFRTAESNTSEAIFDEKGFWLSDEASAEYSKIKNEPHLYVAYTDSEEGFYYIGKSYQKGGRWKRSHAYHLGTLAHHLFRTIRYDDQNHSHWIEKWTDSEPVAQPTINTIGLKHKVFISFIPFKQYFGNDYHGLSKAEIRARNSQTEEALILSYLNDGFDLLNIQMNKKARPCSLPQGNQ